MAPWPKPAGLQAGQRFPAILGTVCRATVRGANPLQVRSGDGAGLQRVLRPSTRPARDSGRWRAQGRQSAAHRSAQALHLQLRLSARTSSTARLRLAGHGVSDRCAESVTCPETGHDKPLVRIATVLEWAMTADHAVGKWSGAAEVGPSPPLQGSPTGAGNFRETKSRMTQPADRLNLVTSAPLETARSDRPSLELQASRCPH